MPAPAILLRRSGVLLAAVVLSLFLGLPAGALDVPPLQGRINDYAGLLSPETARSLERELAAFERETTTQVVVLTVPSLEGDTIENLAIRVADTWKIGQQERGNGVILLLAGKERKIRIEVGTGLQGAVPDITASRIIRNVMAPALRVNDFDRGITAGLAAIMDAAKGEFEATPADRPKKQKEELGPYGTLMMLLLSSLVLAGLAGMASRKLGAMAGAITLPLAVELSLGASHGLLLFLAILGGIGGLFISTLLHGMRSGGGGGSGWGGGGPTIFYGGGGGWGGGSSSSDGGFSGGGGDFDGGGASDDY